MQEAERAPLCDRMRESSSESLLEAYDKKDVSSRSRSGSKSMTSEASVRVVSRPVKSYS
jgi:hypothetical protein